LAKGLALGMSVDLSNYELQPIFVVSLAVILAASEAGRRLGMHVKTRGGDEISTLEAGVLGLLALMISFTFAMALSRFEARRDTVLEEANAIGTTALRARLLPAPHDAATLKLLREYVQLRVDSAHPQHADRHEPERHDGAEQASDPPSALRLQAEQRDQHEYRQRQHVGCERRHRRFNAFERA
jgi:hypothetical protein